MKIGAPWYILNDWFKSFVWFE